MSVEPHYDKFHEGQSKADAVMFSMAQELEGKHKTGAVVLSCNVADARSFASAVSKLCDGIENGSKI